MYHSTNTHACMHDACCMCVCARAPSRKHAHVSGAPPPTPPLQPSQPHSPYNTLSASQIPGGGEGNVTRACCVRGSWGLGDRRQYNRQEANLNHTALIALVRCVHDKLCTVPS